MLKTFPEGDHQANGLAKVGVREIKAQTRMRSQLEQGLGMQRIMCPDTKSWTMVERLISVDVEKNYDTSSGGVW